MKILLTGAALLLLAVPVEAQEPNRPETKDELAWEELRPAILSFQAEGDRAAFLAALKGIRTCHPGSEYEAQLGSLIEPLEREAATGEPAFLAKHPDERTADEEIRCRLHALRDLKGEQFSGPGYPFLFWMPINEVSEADRVVALGVPAIPRLVEALEDDTPTRSVTFGRSWYSTYHVLRRRDLALHCLEHITGCRFYTPSNTGMNFHSESEALRNSVLLNVQKWWKESRGAEQPRMIRNQLELCGENRTLRVYERLDMLEVLAALEGPEVVLPELRRRLTKDKDGLNSPIARLVGDLDRRTVVRGVFDRFAKNASRSGDYRILYEYGDREVYRGIALRFVETGRLDPDEWVLGEQAERAAKYGQNWAIPILARLLDDTRMHGTRAVAPGLSRRFCDADQAVEPLQELTGVAFGYDKRDEDEKRLAAIARAKRWVESGGLAKIADRIEEDHPPVSDPGDLFLSDAEVDEQVWALEGDDAKRRCETVAALGTAFSPRIQRGLLRALENEADPVNRRVILAAIGRRPMLWQLPALLEVFADDGDEETRIRAGQVIVAVMGETTFPAWWIRIETREAALDISRRITADPEERMSVRRVAVEVLVTWQRWTDLPLLRDLAAKEEWSAWPPLAKHLDRWK